MCTALVRIDPAGAWPVLVAFVRDEDRGRPTDPAGFWWPRQPGIVGGRDARAGGTWLAVDVGGDGRAPQVAFVQNRIGDGTVEPDVGASPSRGQLPLLALETDRSFDPSQLPELDRYQPFHLVRARPLADGSGEVRADWWQWSGRSLEHVGVTAGLHLVASRGLDLPGERDRRAAQLARFADAPAPTPTPGATPRRAWGQWLDLLDARGVQPGDLGALAVHSISERPGFGTVGATLVAIGAGGSVRLDTNRAHDLHPEAWVAADLRAAPRRSAAPA